MRKQLLLFTFVLIGLLTFPSISKSAVNPIPGNIEPEISTDAVPKWYTIMSSHLSDANRQNRFLVWDGTRLKTEKFDEGIPENQLEDKYLWRLEQGSGENKVYIVNKTGLRIYAPDGVNPMTNTPLSVNESGVEWDLKLASATGQADCADKQYCFNFAGAVSTPAYLNAMDSQNNNEELAFGITVYHAGVHQASGWFFYKANIQEEVTEDNKAVLIPKSQITNYSGTAYRLEFSETLLGDRNGGATDRNGKSFTISTWVNFTEITGNSNTEAGDGTVIMGHGAQEHMNHNGSIFLCVKPNGKLYLGGGANNISGRDLNANIVTNTWTYLTIVYDNDTQSVSVYKDGAIVETVNMEQQLKLFDDDPAIFYVGGVMFSGMCDEFQYFNKALTAADVLTAYKNPNGIDGLTALYDFNSIAEETTGQFENKIKSSDKADIKAVFNKYTTNTVWQNNDLVSGSVTEFAPTLTEGRTPATTSYSVTLPIEVANGTLTVMNGETALVAGENEVEKGAILTITATPASGYVLDYLKINDTPFTESTYTVTENAVITVAFKAISAEITYCTPTFEKEGNVGIVMYASTEGAQTNLLYDNKANGKNHPAGKPNGLAGNQIEALQGSEINLNLFIDTWWGVAYAYADTNANGSFEESEKLGQWGSDETHGYEDHVNGIQCFTNGTTPTFAIPSDLPVGTIFRIRVIMGSATESTACGTWKEGSYYDFEVKVVSDVSDQFTITLPESLENGTLTVKAGERNITNGEKVDNGTALTITATPAPGYVLDYLKVNDTPLTESTYTVTEDIVITVAFVEELAEVTPKAVHVPGRDGNIGSQFRFDDIVLGEHENGTNNLWENGVIVNRGDNRARNFTMSVWVKPLNATGELFGHIQAGFYNSQGTFGVGINSDNQLVLNSRAWRNEGVCDGINALTSDETLNIGEWAFLTVAVDDDARTIKLYKNGVLLLTGDLTVTKDGNEAHGIGLLQDECVFFAGTSGSSCDVDEIQVWNKTLTVDEILASRNSYTTAPENLVALYKFDESSIENVPNQGSGVACNANLVSGNVIDHGWWVEYKPSPIKATLVDGHILPKFAVNYVSETEHGSFIIKDGDNTIASGSKVSQGTTLTIETTPAEGYQVKSIKVNDVEIEGNTFVVEEESTITVEFTNKLFVKYTVTGSGSFTILDANTEEPINSGDEITKGTFVMIMINADEDSEISSFTINGVEEKESIIGGIYMIPSCQTNLDINVEFTKKQFNVVFNSNALGTLTVKKNDVAIESNTLVEYGTELTITAKPTGSATLSKFTINGVDKLNEIKETMEMNVTVNSEMDIQAEFSTPTWTVTYNITGEGSVKIEDEEGNVYESGVSPIPDGTMVTLTFTPATGYELTDLKIEDESYFLYVSENKFTFEISDNYNFDVVFSEITSIHNESADAVTVYYAAGTLQVTGMNSGDRLDIYDITGNYVRTSEEANTNVSDLANGCYLVKVTVGNTVKTMKFIKR